MGAVKRVWEICEELHGLPRATVIQACVDEGININTSRTQYQRWFQQGRPSHPLPVYTSLPRHSAAVQAEWEQLQSRFQDLKSWRFEIDYISTARGGCCHYAKKTVAVSAWVLEHAPEEEAMDTLRHEAAHALAPCGSHHNAEWKAWCLKVGARPERSYDTEIAAFAPVTERRTKRPISIICPRHGIIRRMWREPKWFKEGRTATCGKCGSRVKVVRQNIV